MSWLAVIQISKALVCEATAILLFVVRYTKRRNVRIERWLCGVFAAFLAIVAIIAYFDFGYFPKHGRFMNPHGWFHYYLGAKYSREVGYYDFYRAVVVANTDNHSGVLAHTRLRNLKTYGNENPSVVVRNAERYRNLFTPERWELFKKDVAYFESIFIPRRWPGVVMDKGYNATPMWNMFASALTNLSSTDNPASMLFLLSLDLVLTATALAMVWRAFGLHATFLLLVYVSTHFAFFMYDVNEIRGAFLRLDWVMTLVMAMCCLKLQRPRTAGALAAYAASSRLFPVIFAFGVFCRLAWSWFGTRAWDRQLMSFVVVFALAIIGIAGASFVWDGGFQHWDDFLTKIRMHDDDVVAQRVGFKYIFLDTFHGPAGKAKLFEERQAVWWVIQGTVLFVTFLLTRKLQSYEALALGYLPLFFLTAPTTYYQIGLAIPFLYFAAQSDRMPYTIGAALGLFVSATFTVFNVTRFPEGQYAMSYTMSWIILAFLTYAAALAMATSYAWRGSQGPKSDPVTEQEASTGIAVETSV